MNIWMKILTITLLVFFTYRCCNAAEDDSFLPYKYNSESYLRKLNEEEKNNEILIVNFIKQQKNQKVFRINILSNDAHNNLNNEYLSYIFTFKKLGAVESNMSIYKANLKTGKVELKYRERLFPFVLIRITPIEKGFLVVYHQGIGRSFGFLIFSENNKGKMEIAFAGMYDFLELAYFRGFNGMPHLFGTSCNQRLPNKGKIDEKTYFQFTDVFEWNNNENKYIKIITIKYGEKILFKDRFNIIDGETPFFTPNTWHLYD
jgi:hypothetical protein